MGPFNPAHSTPPILNPRSLLFQLWDSNWGLKCSCFHALLTELRGDTWTACSPNFSEVNFKIRVRVRVIYSFTEVRVRIRVRVIG